MNDHRDGDTLPKKLGFGPTGILWIGTRGAHQREEQPEEKQGAAAESKGSKKT